jgi:hypothetical protein
MQPRQETEVAKRVLRTVICPACYQSPPQDQDADCTTPRGCEPECTIFQNTTILREIAAPPPASRSEDYHRAIRERICNETCTRPTAGEHCVERQNLSCPLVRLMDYVITALRWMPPGTGTPGARTDAARGYPDTLDGRLS